MAMNEEVAGVEDGMERREEEGWVGVIWLGGRKGGKSGEVVGKDKTKEKKRQSAHSFLFYLTPK